MKMKNLKTITTAVLLTVFASAPFMGLAADSKPEKAKTEKVKPYTLETCAVSGEKLGQMGDPYVFNYEGKEYKLCCKGCLKDFKKDPAKYVKQVDQAEAKAKKKKAS